MLTIQRRPESATTFEQIRVGTYFVLNFPNTKTVYRKVDGVPRYNCVSISFNQDVDTASIGMESVDKYSLVIPVEITHASVTVTEV